MPIVAFTTLTMPESSAQPVSYDDNTVLVAFDGQADDIPAEEESLSLPLNLVNERIRKKMDRDVFKFKNINMQLSDLPETQPESVEGDSSLIPGEQLFETETSSAPRVLSINIVLPTFAIRITEDPGVSDIETVLSIASFINNPEETTRAPVSPIFDAPDVTQENQRASGMLAKPVETPVISSRFPDRNFASVSAVQRHEITLDEMELLSILHMQSIVPMVASTAPPAGFYGAPMHTPPVVQGISSAPAPLNAPSFYPPPPMPRPVSSAVEPSRSWPTPRHSSGDDDGDDDDMDSDWDNESTTTHMLDVDRARNHRRIGAKTLNFDNDSSSSRSTNSNDGGDDSSSDDEDDDSDTVSDSDDDSDSNDT
ncbi:hypothetical protein EV175_004504, partial [Coemansia sp. RSA 1933]